MLTDSALRERVGRAARETVLAEHTWLRNAERVLALLREHTGRNGKAAAE